MKKNVFTIGILAIVALGFTSCKDEKQVTAEKSVNNYVVYVDSLGNVDANDAKANWTTIDANYQTRFNEAEISVTDAKDNEALREKLESSKEKYEALKAKYQAELDADAKMAANSNYKMRLRNSLFGEGSMGEDISFDWVNKDNILRVYNDFNNEYDKNHKNYTREDFDEIKALYEALDSRKNTLEKEGLSSSDNGKIAELKFKFGPKFKIDRMGAKAGENKDAKDEAN